MKKIERECPHCGNKKSYPIIYFTACDRIKCNACNKMIIINKGKFIKGIYNYA